MGVSGGGKSTLGNALAESLKVPFIEGDDFHFQFNIEKMKNGIPLTDADRIPWLSKLGKQLEKQQRVGAVLACSALKASYRELLTNRVTKKKILWVYLKCEMKQLSLRMRKRNHFMPLSLLQSQLDTLEEPKEAVLLDGNLSILEMMHLIKKQLNDLQNMGTDRNGSNGHEPRQKLW